MTHRKTIVIGEYEYICNILDATRIVLDNMISNNEKVYCVRLDIHFPENFPYSNRNAELSALMQRVIQNFRYHKIECRYIAVREQNISPLPHYHCLLLLNGNEVNSGWGVRDTVAKTWIGIVGAGHKPCIHLCLTHEGLDGIMIVRPSPKSDDQTLNEDIADFLVVRQAVLEWARYLAKTYTKGAAPPHVREYVSSRVLAPRPLGEQMR